VPPSVKGGCHTITRGVVKLIDSLKSGWEDYPQAGDIKTGEKWKFETEKYEREPKNRQKYNLY